MKKILLICISLLLLFSSCRKIVQDEFASFENKITLNSILVEGETAKLHLSLTNGLNEYALSNITNAQIEMYNQDSLRINFEYDKNGIYISDYLVNENDKFTLTVRTETDSINTSCVVPIKTEFLDFYVQERAWVNYEGLLQPEVNFTVPNNKSETKYFEASILIYNKIGEYVDMEDPILYFDNIGEHKDSIYKKVRLKFTSFSSSSESYQYKYKLIIKSVDKNYYEYVKSFEDYNISREPNFSTSSVVPTNLYSNIENGYGVFCAYSQVCSEIIEPIY
jgi:hypothetical protein